MHKRKHLQTVHSANELRARCRQVFVLGSQRSQRGLSLCQLAPHRLQAALLARGFLLFYSLGQRRWSLAPRLGWCRSAYVAPALLWQVQGTPNRCPGFNTTSQLRQSVQEEAGCFWQKPSQGWLLQSATTLHAKACNIRMQLKSVFYGSCCMMYSTKTPYYAHTLVEETRSVRARKGQGTSVCMCAWLFFGERLFNIRIELWRVTAWTCAGRRYARGRAVGRCLFASLLAAFSHLASNSFLKPFVPPWRGPHLSESKQPSQYSCQRAGRPSCQQGRDS